MLKISPVPATGFSQIESGFGEQDGGGDGFSAVDGGIADLLIEFLFGLGAQNGFVGRADGAEHPVETAHRPLAGDTRGLMLEIVERERDVLPTHVQASKRSAPPIESRFTPRDKEYADASAVAGQRQRRGRADVPGLGALAPGQRPRIVEKIVADS